MSEGWLHPIYQPRNEKDAGSKAGNFCESKCRYLSWETGLVFYCVLQACMDYDHQHVIEQLIELTENEPLKLEKAASKRWWALRNDGLPFASAMVKHQVSWPTNPKISQLCVDIQVRVHIFLRTWWWSRTGSHVWWSFSTLHQNIQSSLKAQYGFFSSLSKLHLD